jgi:hypothetical protein
VAAAWIVQGLRVRDLVAADSGSLGLSRRFGAVARADSELPPARSQRFGPSRELPTLRDVTHVPLAVMVTESLADSHWHCGTVSASRSPTLRVGVGAGVSSGVPVHTVELLHWIKLCDAFICGCAAAGTLSWQMRSA